MYHWYHYAIAIIGSAIAGGINTLAGNGSAITLPILMEVLGLPETVANATNRVGIFTQNIASTFSYYKNGKLDVARSWLQILLIVSGAIVGVVAATVISNEGFAQVFRYLMVVMLLLVLVKPSRWLREQKAERPLPLWLNIPMLLGLGFYGGFIQMGFGVFFLAVMVLGAGFNFLNSNVLKSAVILIYTAIVLAIFHYKGLIDWKIGALMALGQTTGGFLAAEFAVKYPNSGKWAYRILIAVIIVAIFRLFGVL